MRYSVPWLENAHSLKASWDLYDMNECLKIWKFADLIFRVSESWPLLQRMAATRRLQKELGDLRKAAGKSFRDIQVVYIIFCKALLAISSGARWNWFWIQVWPIRWMSPTCWCGRACWCLTLLRTTRSWSHAQIVRYLYFPGSFPYRHCFPCRVSLQTTQGENTSLAGVYNLKMVHI